MKIRQGFVSNSSSASYIVTINSNIDKDEFLLSLYHDLYYDFKNIEDDFIETVERYNKLDKFEKVFKFIPNPEKFNDTNKYFTYEPVLTREQQLKAITIGLERAGLTLNKNMTGYDITAFTAMHNSCNDIPKILSTIYFTYYTQGLDVNFRIEED